MIARVARHVAWNRTQASPSTTTPAAGPAAPAASITLPRLATLLLWLGTIPVGGKTFGIFFDELVRRRDWLSAEVFLEGQTLARALPGPKTPNMVVFLAHRLCGPRGVAVALVAFLLPGTLAMILLTAFVFGAARPPWLDGALGGFSAAGVGVILASTLRMMPSVGGARFGAIVASLAFIANGLVGLDLLVVLPGAGLLSLLSNLPERKAA
jgi:chromate transporter